MHVCVCAGLRALALKLPPEPVSSGNGGPAFELRPRLTNATQMAQWMTAVSNATCTPANVHLRDIAKLSAGPVTSDEPVHSITVDSICTECTDKSLSLSGAVHDSSSSNSRTGCSCYCKDSSDHSDDLEKSDDRSGFAGATGTECQALSVGLRLGLPALGKHTSSSQVVLVKATYHQGS